LLDGPEVTEPYDKEITPTAKGLFAIRFKAIVFGKPIPILEFLTFFTASIFSALSFGLKILDVPTT
jgi:hypothetical protein